MNAEEQAIIQKYLSERARKAGSVMTDKKRKAILRNLANARKTRWKNNRPSRAKRKTNHANPNQEGAKRPLKPRPVTTITTPDGGFVTYYGDGPVATATFGSAQQTPGI